MYYTIATMQECCVDNPMILDICKSGNKYEVVLSRGGINTRRRFDSITEAYKVFEKLASWLVMGFYSEEDRRSYLATGWK